ncbi:MAG: 2-oxo acid dehydrogenase subunit E2 [Novosphingobium sp.]|nr:2-oxo acid dehydrogenase subunit E2 [Novosphingobium sp.]
MARFVFRMPDVGEGITEAEIVAWHVQPGARIDEETRLVDVMTDKATVEVESPVSGTVVEVAGEIGSMVPVGATLAVIETEAEEAVDAVPAPQAPVAKPAPEAAPSEPEDAADAKPHPAAAQPQVLASPAVRARARDLGIDLAQIRPASDGRIRHADLDAFLAYDRSGGFRPAGARRADEVVKVIGLRRRIAENMAAAKRAIPHFTYVEECDVTLLETMRAQLNEARGERPKLTLLPLLATIICRTLPDYPMLNARYDDEAGEVTRHGAVHLGMAAQTHAGLMVPVIRDAQDRNLWQLAGEIRRLAEAARDGSIASNELSGSTITLSSLGPLGGIASTPVVNRPEVAIIAPNRIVERPMFVPDGIGGERIEKRKLMNISISCDHRVVDGHDAASFVQAVKRLIEHPFLLLDEG